MIVPAGDIVQARGQARTHAKNLGFKGAELTTIATIFSDLAHYALRHGEHGDIYLERIEDVGRHGIQCTLRILGTAGNGEAMTRPDEAPARPESNHDLTRFKSFMDEFQMRTEIGGITTVVISKWFS